MELAIKNRTLITFVNLGLGALLVISALFLFRDITKLILLPNQQPASEKAQKTEKSRPQLQAYAPILRTNPFGFPASELSPLSAGTGGSRSSAVTLVGTIAGSRKDSYAILMNDTGEQQIFRPGESVFGTGTLENVDSTKIVIAHAGASREITLAGIVPPEGEAGQPYTPPIIPAGFSKRIAENSYTVDQKKIQNAISNPKDLMTDARLLPNYSEGKQEGYVLSEIKPGGIYQSLGLLNGDVLIRINDFDISNPENALQAFTALRGMEKVDLNIVRNGSRMTLTYRIQ